MLPQRRRCRQEAVLVRVGSSVLGVPGELLLRWNPVLPVLRARSASQVKSSRVRAPEEQVGSPPRGRRVPPRGRTSSQPSSTPRASATPPPVSSAPPRAQARNRCLRRATGLAAVQGSAPHPLQSQVIVRQATSLRRAAGRPRTFRWWRGQNQRVAAADHRLAADPERRRRLALPVLQFVLAPAQQLRLRKIDWGRCLGVFVLRTCLYVECP